MRYFVVLLVFFLAGCSGSTEVKSTSGEVPRASKPASAASVGLQQRLALVIGNQDYAVKPLYNPLNDARDMAEELEKLNFRVTITTNARHRDMKEALDRFAETLRSSGGIGLFYYSGHGLQYQNRNYLVPIGVNFKRGADISYQAVNVQQISDTLAEVNQNGVNILVLDACRDSPFKSITKNYGNGLTQIGSPQGSLIAYATAPNSVAIGTDNERNSIFTKYLLSALRDPIKTALSITDLFIEVGAQVSAATNGTQVPWQSVALTNRLCLGICGATPFAYQGHQLNSLQKELIALKAELDKLNSNMNPGVSEISKNKPQSYREEQTIPSGEAVPPVREILKPKKPAKVILSDEFLPVIRSGWVDKLTSIKYKYIFKELNGTGVEFTQVRNLLWGKCSPPGYYNAIPSTPEGLKILLEGRKTGLPGRMSQMDVCPKILDKTYLLEKAFHLRGSSTTVFDYTEKAEIINIANKNNRLCLVHEFIGTDKAGNEVRVMETTPKHLP